MKISVVIPTFNRLWALPRSVSQFYDDPLVGEILVVNDASTDGTCQWLDQESQKRSVLKAVHHRENCGATGARNTGIDKAQNDYILFWDDDMVLMPSGGLQILLGELLRYKGDMIAPAFAVSEGAAVPRMSSPAGSPDSLVASDVLLDRWTFMMRNVTPAGLPKQTFQSPLLFGLTLQNREIYRDVRYSEDLAPTCFRDETDLQLALVEQGRRLLACPFVYALDMKRLLGQNDGGCHSQGTLLRYDLLACRNNWRMLRRRRRVIRSGLGIRWPIGVLQTVFIFDRLLYRLPRRIAGMTLRKGGLLK